MSYKERIREQITKALEPVVLAEENGYSIDYNVVTEAVLGLVEKETRRSFVNGLKAQSRGPRK